MPRPLGHLANLDLNLHQLELHDIRPRIAVRVESCLAVPHFVAGTDRIALMQERLAARRDGRPRCRPPRPRVGGYPS